MSEPTTAYVVRAWWDEAAKVWVAESDDVPGLATGAANLDELVAKLRIIVPELLEENGIIWSRHDDGRKVPISLMTEINEVVRMN